MAAPACVYEPENCKLTKLTASVAKRWDQWLIFGSSHVFIRFCMSNCIDDAMPTGTMMHLELLYNLGIAVIIPK